MILTRRQCRTANNPYEGIVWRQVSGDNWLTYTLPAAWSASACQLWLREVFYHYPIPALRQRVVVDAWPVDLCPAVVDMTALDAVSAEHRFVFETDIREVIDRVAGGMMWHLLSRKLIDEDEAAVFFDEARALMIRQMVLPDVAVLATLGLDWAYGISASSISLVQGSETPAVLAARLMQGSVAKTPATVTLKPDDVVSTQALVAAWQTLCPAHKIDIQIPVENPASLEMAALARQKDISAIAENFGRRQLRGLLEDIMAAGDRGSIFGFDPARNPALAASVRRAVSLGVPLAAIDMALARAANGDETLGSFTDAAGGDEAELTVAPAVTLGLPDEFIESALTGHGFLQGGDDLPARHISAASALDDIADMIWSAGQPRLYWRDHAGRSQPWLSSITPAPVGIAAGGMLAPAGESAPVGVINLLPFAQDIESLAPVAFTAALMLEGCCDQTTRSTVRPIALSLSNLAANLMTMGLAYDSDDGRSAAAYFGALATAGALGASSLLAARGGAFDVGFDGAVRKSVLQWIKDKRAALAGTAFGATDITRRSVTPQVRQPRIAPLATLAVAALDEAYDAARESGLYNAHVTMMATPRILQQMMDARTLDCAPDVSLVDFAGHDDTAGIYLKKLNPAVPAALGALGYSAAEIDDIHFYAAGHGTLLDAPAINHASLRARGFHQAAIDAIEAALTGAQHIRYAFNKWVLGADFCERMLGINMAQLDDAQFDMLRALDFDEDDIEAANLYCCGSFGLEGAPHLKPEHLAVFDCLLPAARAGVRRVTPSAQIAMQAAIEPYLSGVVAQTIELDHHASLDDVRGLILRSWELGAKTLSLYRAGCALTTPMLMADLGGLPKRHKRCKQMPLKRHISA